MLYSTWKFCHTKGVPGRGPSPESRFPSHSLGTGKDPVVARSDCMSDFVLTDTLVIPGSTDDSNILAQRTDSLINQNQSHHRNNRHENYQRRVDSYTRSHRLALEWVEAKLRSPVKRFIDGIYFMSRFSKASSLPQSLRLPSNTVVCSDYSTCRSRGPRSASMMRTSCYEISKVGYRL
jgi:hypothetical protein